MNKYNGLTKKEVEKNQIEYGKNELIKVKKPNFILVFINEFKDLLVIILIIAALLSVIVDPHSIFESIIIMAILIMNALIGAIQEIKAFKTLNSLKKLSSHQIKVIRDNELQLITPSELTINDLVIVEKGDMVDADLIIISSNELKMDESALTGESIPVEKKENDHLYSATFVVSGSARAIVNKIGMNTKIGHIANSLLENKNEKTPIEVKLNQIGKIIGIAAIIICIGVFFIELAMKIEIIEAFKSSISLAVAAIPEGLATVVTVCLAIGVNKMAKQNVIIKRLDAVETLGCSDVVCSDKTGTLTENKEKIIMIYEDRLYEIDELNKVSNKFLQLLYLTIDFVNKEEVTDPIDKAILELYHSNEFNKYNYNIIKYYPFTSELKYSKVDLAYENNRISIFKGAYDILSDLVIKKPTNEINKAIDLMMNKGYRVIALANEYKILGLIAMQDLPKDNVERTIELSKNAFVNTIMITGDHFKTAFAIAKQIGITNDINEVITKEELDKISDIQLEKKVKNYKVYARVNPLDKVRIVNAWKKTGAIVAMTGDGINDAPALKAADIGCAMGNGTEIAKDASDVIIVDSNYNSIINAIKNGRNIYENIKKCCKYLLASNIGEVLTIVIITIASLIININLGIPLASIHLLWINIITDSLPAFGLGLIEGTDDVMTVPPRRKNENFFSKKEIYEILFIGFSIGLLTVISYLLGLKINSLYASTMAFVTISSSQLFHSYNCASGKTIFTKNLFKHKFLNYSWIVGFVLMLSVVYITPINDLFVLQKLPPFILVISITLAILIIPICEIMKFLANKQRH